MAGSLQQLFTTQRNGAWRTGSQPGGLWCACLPLGYSDYWDCMRSLDLARHIALQVGSFTSKHYIKRIERPQSVTTESRKPYEAQRWCLLRLQSLLKRQKCKQTCELWTFQAWRFVQLMQSRRICPWKVAFASQALHGLSTCFLSRRIPLRTNGDTCIKEKMAPCADMWWSSGLQERFPAPDAINPLLSNLTLSWIKSWAKVVNEDTSAWR